MYFPEQIPKGAGVANHGKSKYAIIAKSAVVERVTPSTVFATVSDTVVRTIQGVTNSISIS